MHLVLVQFYDDYHENILSHCIIGNVGSSICFFLMMKKQKLKKPMVDIWPS